MLHRLNIVCAIVLLLLVRLSVQGDVVVDKMFSDHMVLQRDLDVPIWGTATAGEKISVSFRGQAKETIADKDGNWTIKLDPMKVDGAAELTVTAANTVVFKDVLVGEVWVGSGQSNMGGNVKYYKGKDQVLATWGAGGPYQNLRLYKGDWKVADAKTIERFSAIHFAFGFRLHQELKVPVGLMVGAQGGTPSQRWLSPAMVKADKSLMAKLGGVEWRQVKDSKEGREWAELVIKPRADSKKTSKKVPRPTAVGDLYAKHIEYMIPYGIRGVLWDQGENKSLLRGCNQFMTMRALIAGWRRVWGQGDFYFLHVQKPSGGRPAFDPANPLYLQSVPFSATYPKGPASRPRSMAYTLNHLKLARIKNAPLVIACDLAPGIHPPTKSAYGQRACRVALGAVYGRDVAISGPVYKSHKVVNGTMCVTFDHVGKGLVFKHADTVRGFAVAGSNGKWAWANAEIDGDTIVVSSSDVPTPTMVQFAFKRNSSFANLYNKDGLPALPFITTGDPVEE